jgi:hypothetical protein
VDEPIGVTSADVHSQPPRASAVAAGPSDLAPFPRSSGQSPASDSSLLNHYSKPPHSMPMPLANERRVGMRCSLLHPSPPLNSDKGIGNASFLIRLAAFPARPDFPALPRGFDRLLVAIAPEPPPHASPAFACSSPVLIPRKSSREPSPWKSRRFLHRHRPPLAAQIADPEPLAAPLSQQILSQHLWQFVATTRSSRIISVNRQHRKSAPANEE